jgi:hypothetical protein
VTLVNADTGEIVACLADLESVIERGLSSFVEVGEALMTIRDEKLYRQDHDTFEAYCRERWGFGKAHSYRLIESAEVVAALSPMGDVPVPTTERQARALTPVKDNPEQMAEAMKRASRDTNGKPTAVAIADAVSDLVNSTEEKRQDEAELKALMTELQPTGFDRHENARLVQRRGRFSAICADLSNFGEPAGVVVDLRDAPRADRFLSRAQAAHAWLSDFLTQWEAK